MVLAVLVPVLFFIAFVGWGQLITRLVRPASAPDFGLLSAWGMAAILLLGGVLNLCGLVGVAAILAILLVGAGTCAASVWRERRRFLSVALRLRRTPSVVMAIVLLCVLLIVMLNATGSLRFNPHDDMHAYLVFPAKMIEAGGMGRDPFSERRMMEYGGQIFLHAMAIPILGLNRIHAMDLGVAWLVVLSLVLGHSRRNSVPLGIALLVLIGLQFIAPPVVNVTSVISGVALFYALLRTFVMARAERSWARCMLLALVIAGTVTLKNSYIPACGLLSLVLLLFCVGGSFRTRALEVLCVGLLVSVFLLPWAISMFRSNGTFLYPILGKGFYGSVYGPFVSVSCGTISAEGILYGFGCMTRSLEFVSCSVLALASLVISPRRRVIGLVYLCVWVTALALGIVSGDSRYSYPFVFAATVFVLVESLSSSARARGVRALWRFTPLVVLLVLTVCWSRANLQHGFFLGLDARRISELFHTVQWRGVLSAPQDLDSGGGEMRELQSKVPAGAPILARVSRAFNLDLKRNTVYVIDWPGGSSPPPGMPCFGKAEDLAGYLRQQGVRYVMYSYGDQAAYPEFPYANRLVPGDGFVARLRSVTEYTFAFQDRLMELSGVYKKLADNGKAFVLDLDCQER